MSGFEPGRLAKLYLNDGTYDTPSWVAIERVGDVTRTQTKTTSTVATREHDVEWTLTNVKQYSISFTYNERPDIDDSVLTALLDSYEAEIGDSDYAIDIAAMNMDVATVGAKGTRGYYTVTEATRNEPFGDSVNRSFTLSPVLVVESDVDIVPAPYEITV